MGEVKAKDMFVYEEDDNESKAKVKDKSDTECYCRPGEAWKAQETSSEGGGGARDDDGCPTETRPAGDCVQICPKYQVWVGGHDGDCTDKVCMDWGESFVARAAQTEMAKAVLNTIYSDPALTKTVEDMYGFNSALNLQSHQRYLQDYINDNTNNINDTIKI